MKCSSDYLGGIAVGIEAIIAVIINGIFQGGVYGLMSSAWSFQVGALRYANFAYGASIMVSMYLTYYMIRVWMFPVVLAISVILLYNILFGLLMRKTVLRNKSYSTMILATMGLQLILINVITILFSAYPRNLGLTIQRIQLTQKISINPLALICFFLSLIILVSFQVFLKRTWMGRAVRAVVQNQEVATLMGIDGQKIIDIAFSLSYALIGISAIILMTMFQVEPTFGGKLQTYAFLICVSAGLGNIGGAFVSGIAMGVISSLISLFLPSAYHDPILFGLFVVLLLWKPYGLFTKSDKIAKTI